MKYTEYLLPITDFTWFVIVAHTFVIAILLGLVFGTVLGILLRTKYKNNYFAEERAVVATNVAGPLIGILSLALAYWFWPK